MAKVVRDGRLVDGYLPPAKKRKWKDIAWLVWQQYDMGKDISMSRPQGWHEHYDVPNEKKGKVYREYLNSPKKTKGNGSYTGTKKEKTTRWEDKTTSVTLKSKKKKLLDKLTK